jgi:hypothetical protein
MGLDRVLERAAVDLDRIGHAVERAREDRRAHDQVVGERDVGTGALGHLAHGGHVGRQVSLDLVVGQVRERARLHALVAVGDVERQEPADVRPVHRGLDGLAAHGQRELPAVPVACRVDPVKRQRVAVLTEHVHLVAGPLERLAERAVVDVRAGSGQQIAVEDEHPHAAALYELTS